jgi:hypothetical protein
VGPAPPQENLTASTKLATKVDAVIFCDEENDPPRQNRINLKKGTKATNEQVNLRARRDLSVCSQS